MPYRIGEVAERANVPEDFVQQLIELGALPGEEAGLGIPEVRRSRLLHSWAAAGLSVETILALVDRGALSLAFLDTPWMETPGRLDRSYRQLAADRASNFEWPRLERWRHGDVSSSQHGPVGRGYGGGFGRPSTCRGSRPRSARSTAGARNI